MKKRHENVKSFQENSSIKAALLSLTAASIGLTLTEASTVIFAEVTNIFIYFYIHIIDVLDTSSYALSWG